MSESSMKFKNDQDATAFAKLYCECANWFGFGEAFATRGVAIVTVPKGAKVIVPKENDVKHIKIDDKYVPESVDMYRTNTVIVDRMEVKETEKDGPFKRCRCFGPSLYKPLEYKEGKRLHEEIRSIRYNLYGEGIWIHGKKEDVE